MGITDFSLIFCLKLIFFIIFIFLNICLFYTEYLDRKFTNIKNPDTHLKSGLTPELQRIAKNVLAGIGLISGFITIKNEFKTQQELEEVRAHAQAILAQAAEDTKKAATTQTANNFIHKLHITNIQNSFSDVVNASEK